MQSATEALRTRHIQSGFTLIEFMVALACVGVLLTVAVPTMRLFSQNNRLTSASNDLLRSFQIARSEAIKRRENVVVCASSDPTIDHPVCSYGPFQGWIVFQDTNNNWQADDVASEPVLDVHRLIDATVTVRTDKDGIVSYNPSGFANIAGAKVPSRNVVLCDERGITKVDNNDENSTARAFVISPTGRVYVTKNYSAVNMAASAAGACP
jgi:type IV fimbrial biogenesis protein FimT